MEEIRIDMRERTAEEQAVYDRQAQLMFKLNHTMPRTEEYMAVLKELFEDRIGEGSYVAAPLGGAAMEKLIIGKHCFLIAICWQWPVAASLSGTMFRLPEMCSCFPIIMIHMTGRF